MPSSFVLEPTNVGEGDGGGDGGGGGGADAGAVAVAAVASTGVATVVGDPSNTMTSPFSTTFSCRSWMPSSFVLEPTNVGEGDRGGDGGADAGAVAVAVEAGVGDASSGLDWTMDSLC